MPSPGGSALGGMPGGDPPGRPLLRAVRILLECILVFLCNHIINDQNFVSITKNYSSFRSVSYIYVLKVKINSSWKGKDYYLQELSLWNTSRFYFSLDFPDSLLIQSISNTLMPKFLKIVAYPNWPICVSWSVRLSSWTINLGHVWHWVGTG